ncbi:hypothetical protein BJY01DRAFT_19848 [Aspergillus pseudoustus]|uniref:Uncharacterized protein n=1 Tax=Aspergillus pseudoustus TaxID=1810923 RepID=A0ABR4KRV1_9EURO
MTKAFPSMAVILLPLPQRLHNQPNNLFRILNMNWTGGRLRRHTGPNDKCCKQKFKRPTTASKGPHQITLFNGLGLAEAQDTEKSGGEPSKGASQSQTTRNPSPTPPQSPASLGPSTRLGQIKRQLLETTDWGVVGAARPVQVSFTSEAELERFGKRRRLTEKDYERLNTTRSTMLAPARPGFRKEVAVQEDLCEDLEIRINGRRLGQGDKGSDRTGARGDGAVLPDVASEQYGHRVGQHNDGSNGGIPSVLEGPSLEMAASQYDCRSGRHNGGPNGMGIPDKRRSEAGMVSLPRGPGLGQLNGGVRGKLPSIDEEDTPYEIYSHYGHRFGQREKVQSDANPSVHDRNNRNARYSQYGLQVGQQNRGRPSGGLIRRGSSVDEGFSPNMVSSQSMLLDYEGSIASNNRVSGQDSLASMNSAGRSGSLSMFSDVSQLCYVSDVPGMFEASDAQDIFPHHEETSGSMDWAPEEPIEPLRSQGSSLIIPPPESPVRRRFTIDDQADAERQEKFIHSSAVVEPSIGQEYEERFGASFSRCPSWRAEAVNRRGDAMKPPSTMLPYPQFSWLPDSGRSMQRAESNGINNACSSMAPTREDWSSTNFSRSSRDVAPMTIFGQPVVFQGPDARADNHAMRPLALRGMEFDHAHAYNFSSDEASTSHPRFWSRPA